MAARYLTTKLATDWGPQSERKTTILERVLWFIPRANPSYDAKLERVDRWVIEFPDGKNPEREIGLDSDGDPVLCGPSEVDYGFWLDTNMTFDDFEGEETAQADFDQLWALANDPEKSA